VKLTDRNVGAFADDRLTVYLDKCLPIIATCFNLFDINKAESPIYFGNPSTEKNRVLNLGSSKVPPLDPWFSPHGWFGLSLTVLIESQPNER
jgi:hypothetical protein